MARANPPLSGAFLAELTRHLQGQSPHISPSPTSWLEHALAEQGLTIEQLVRAEGQAQAADQVSIGNSINSLRFLSSNDWREFVESTASSSRSCTAIRQASMPAWTSPRATATATPSKAIARRSPLSEYDVARKAVQLAAKNQGDPRKCARRLLPGRSRPPGAGATGRHAAIALDD